MSVGAASTRPDHAKATRLPSGDNAGGPSTPWYETNGSNRAGASPGPRSVRHESTAAATATRTARAPTTVLARLRFLTGRDSGSRGGTTRPAVSVGEAELAWKTGT